MQKVKKKQQKNLSCFPLSLWTDPQPNEDHEYTPTLNRWENQASVNILSHPLK